MKYIVLIFILVINGVNCLAFTSVNSLVIDNSFESTTEMMDFESFKTEFKLMGENEVIYKSDGSWILVPLGSLSFATGGLVLAYGVGVGTYVGLTASNFQGKATAAGLISGGVIIGGGLIYLGVKMFQKGINNETKKLSRQKLSKY
jgi:hypothetical protein